MRNARDHRIVFIVPLLLAAVLGCGSDDHNKRFTLGKVATLELTIGQTAIQPDSTFAISTADLLPGDEAARASLRIVNTGDADLRISEITLSSDPPGSIRLAAEPESFAPISPGPYTIVPQDAESGSSSIVAHLIVLRPARTVVGTGTIQILSNSVSGGISQPVLVYNLRLETTPPKLVVVPEIVDLSDVPIGESRQASLTVDNRGGDMLIIHRVRLRGHSGFAVAFGPNNWSSTEADSALTVEPPIQVAPGQQAGAAVQYTANGPEDARARLTLYSNDPSAPLGSVVELIANDGVPTTPVVELDAPNGADGPVTCRLVSDATDTEPLTYTWYWQLGDGDSFTTFGPTLEGDVVKDCDRVRCWTQVTDGHGVVSSNVAEAILPFGSDCADENVCTDDSCGIHGGCAYVNNSDTCADSDLCNGAERCLAGRCGVGIPVECSDVSDGCLESSCNPATGRCDRPRMDGLPCSDSDLCNGAETCQSGVCRSGPAVECSDVADPCLQKACNPGTGLCDLPMPDDTSCSDTDLCDGSERCQNGVCHPGTTVDCSGVTDPCLEKTCNPITGQCDKSKPNNTTCVDADLCDGTEACQGGVCQPGTMVDCSGVTNPCLEKACNPATGQCNQAKANNTSCADADLCDGGETCQGGACKPGVPLDCSGVSDPCTERICNPATGLCNKPKPNNTVCADADLCDGAETCQGGACMPSAPVDCSAVTDSCLEKTCNPVTGQCNRPKPNNTVCADMDLCDGTETCQGGVCKAGIAVNCAGVTDPCLQTSCNPVTGQCNRPKPDSAPCADADLCNGNESCQGGACLPGSAIVCSSVTDPCLEASCNPTTGQCDKPKPNNTSCADSDLCDGSETCQSGICQPGTAVDCTGVTDPCIEKICNPATGQCDTLKPNNTSCADSDLCDGGETCQSGVCQPGTAVDCTGVTDPCLGTSCNSVTGLCNKPKANNTSCADSDLCDGGETCQSGVCQPGTAVDCSGVTDPCLETSCNSATGLCNKPKPNNTSCADSDLCDGGETCQSGVCQPGTTVDCTGVTDPCLETSCNPITGLCNKPKANNTSCADSDLCDGRETCQSGICQPGVAIDCSGVTDPCLETTCNPGTGLCNRPKANNTHCADSDLCDGVETCQSGVCQPGTAVDCLGVTDSCLEKSCNPINGLCNKVKPNNTPCPDDDFCDGGETCQSGACQDGIAVDCSGVADPCFESDCNPDTGACDLAKPDDTSCSDGDLCNGSETCQLGGCVVATPTDCSGVTYPCIEAVCNPTSGVCDLFKPDDTPCGPDDLCETAKTCLNGICVGGTAIDCSGVTDGCLQQVCNPATGQCDIPVTEGVLCTDSDACTVDDLCEDGICLPGEPTSGTAQCGCTDPADLMLYYAFDGNLLDQSGNQRDGSAPVVPTYVSGIHGQAVNFNGTYKITVMNGGLLGPTTSRDRTVMFWLDTGINGYGQVIGQYSGSPATDTFEVGYYRPAGYFETAGTGIDVLRYNVGTTLTGWHHWAVVIANGANNVRIYMDGGLVKQGQITLNAAQSSTAVTVGGLAGQGTLLVGAVDELRAYGRALQANEIAQLAGNCTPPSAGDCGDGVIEAGETCDDGNTVNDDSCSNSCIPAWPCESGVDPDGARFIVCADRTSWSSARLKCQALGFDDLASIRTASENAMLTSLALQLTTDLDLYWIGLSDAAAEGQYLWSDGAAVTYSNWDYGEPNNLYLGCAGNEDCMHFYRSGPRTGRWNDAICCAVGVGYACEYRP